jgi:hypothetical protein
LGQTVRKLETGTGFIKKLKLRLKEYLDLKQKHFLSALAENEQKTLSVWNFL